MGGAQISFRKAQKTPSLVGTSDEGELFVVDWTIKPTEDNPKSDLVQKIWQNQRNFRPCVGLDSSVFYDDVELTLHDFNFCIWVHQVDVPIFESMILRDAQITCGAFSPSRPGVILIGRSDGNLDIWDLIDQSHKPTIQYQVVAKPLSYIKFHDNLHHTVVKQTHLPSFSQFARIMNKTWSPSLQCPLFFSCFWGFFSKFFFFGGHKVEL